MDKRLSRLFVDNLSSKTTRHDLDYLFSKYGRINSISLNKGNAYVEYDRSKDASDAIRKLDDTKLHGRRMVVEYAVKTTNNFLKQRKDEYEDDRMAGRCFKCKEKGHIARNCDKEETSKKRSESKSRRSRSRSSSGDKNSKSDKSGSSSKERRSHSSHSSSSKSKRARSGSSKDSKRSKNSAD